MCGVTVPHLAVCRPVDPHLQTTVRAAQRGVRCCPVAELSGAFRDSTVTPNTTSYPFGAGIIIFLILTHPVYKM